MNVRVRMFAAARKAAGSDLVELEMPDGATIGELRGRLAAEVPAVSALVGRATFAIEAEYAGDGREIPPGADVACIPPVSGG